MIIKHYIQWPVIVTPLLLRAVDYKTEITTLRANDEDGDDLTWRIVGGADQDLFTLTEDGALSFREKQSYDAPGDANRDRFYQLTVQVSDGVNPLEHDLSLDSDVTVVLVPVRDGGAHPKA